MNNPHDEDDDLGRRLYAAVVSTKLGVTMDYALENFVPAKVEEGWGELGRILQSTLAENTVEMLFCLKRNPVN